jgi:hypothetical protein
MAEKITTIEFAEQVGLTDVRVRQLINSGDIQAEKRGRDYMIDPKFIQLIKNRPERRGRRKKAA